MSLFQHPHLTRGTVHTPLGAFAVNRGIVDLPEDIGQTLGWTPLDADDESLATGDARTVHPSRGSGARPVLTNSK